MPSEKSTQDRRQIGSVRPEFAQEGIFLQGISYDGRLLDARMDEELMTLLGNDGLSPLRNSSMDYAPMFAQQKQTRVLQQVKELVEQYRFEKLVGIFGLPHQSSCVTEWRYPMMARAFKHLFQCEGVHLYLTELNSANTQRHLNLKGSTHTALDDAPHSTSSETTLDNTASDHPFLEWASFGHAGPKLILPEDGELKLIPTRICNISEAVLMIRMNVDRQHGEGLCVITGSYEQLASITFQQMVLKAVHTLGCCERLHHRGNQLLDVLNNSPNDSIKCFSHDDFQHLRNELSKDILAYTELQQQFMIALSKVIEQRMHLVTDHANRVSELIIAMCDTLEMNEKTTDALVKAAQFMQVTKIYLHEDLLSQPHAWDEEDFEAYHASSSAAMRVLSNLYSLGDSLPYLHCMLERWDGSGFPDGLAGRNIPFGSRILGLCQAYVAMREPKPYREKGLSEKVTLKILSDEAGHKWDPALVELLKTVAYGIKTCNALQQSSRHFP